MNKQIWNVVTKFFVFFAFATVMQVDVIAQNVPDATFAKRKTEEYKLEMWKAFVYPILNENLGLDVNVTEELISKTSLSEFIDFVKETEELEFIAEKITSIEEDNVSVQTVDAEILGDELRSLKIELAELSNEDNNEEIAKIYRASKEDFELNYALGRYDECANAIRKALYGNKKTLSKLPLLKFQNLYAPIQYLINVTNAYLKYSNNEFSAASVSKWKELKESIEVSNKNTGYTLETHKIMPRFPIEDCISFFVEYIISGDKKLRKGDCWTLSTKDQLLSTRNYMPLKNAATLFQTKVEDFKKGKLPKKELELYFNTVFKPNAGLLKDKFQWSFFENIKPNKKNLFSYGGFWLMVLAMIALFVFFQIKSGKKWKVFVKQEKNKIQHSLTSKESLSTHKQVASSEVNKKTKIPKQTIKSRTKNEIIQEKDRLAVIEKEKVLLIQREKDVAYREDKIRKQEKKFISNKKNLVEKEETETIFPPPVKWPTFYAKVPDGNQFQLSTLFRDIDEKHYYVIKQTSETEAIFEISNNKDYQKNAAIRPHLILESACRHDYDNSPTECKTGIEILKSGILKKNGDSWHIIEKAYIKFI